MSMRPPEIPPLINYEKNKGIPFLDIERIQSGELTGKNAEYKRALLEIPQDRKGLNMERVNNFLIERGLAPQDGIVIYPERAKEFIKQAEKIKKKLKIKTVGWDNLYSLYGAKTFYDPNLRLYFVSRHTEGAELNGSEFTEATIIHETVHANSKFRDFAFRKNGLSRIVRTGMSINVSESHTPFWEEGICDYFAGEYKKLYISPETRQIITTLVDLGETNQKNLPISNNDLQNIFERTGYIVKTNDGGTNEGLTLNSTYFYENVAILSLMKKDILSKEDLLATRFNADGLRNFIKKLEQLKSGLYNEVATEEDKEKALGLVLQVLDEKK